MNSKYSKFILRLSINIILVFICGKLYLFFSSYYDTPEKLPSEIGLPDLIWLIIIFIGLNAIDYNKNNKWKVILGIIFFIFFTHFGTTLSINELVCFIIGFLTILSVKFIINHFLEDMKKR